MLNIYTIIEYYSWLVLFLVWLPGHFTSKKTLRRPFKGKRLVINLLLLGCFLILFSPLTDSRILPARVNPANHLFGIIGLLLDLAGILFAIWARFYLGRNWSGTITVKENHQLIQNGPYALVRHPIYTGFVFAIFGTAITIGLALSYFAAILGLIAFLARVKEEDALMAEQFRSAHTEYRNKTKKLIPFIW